jgi:hypothetical protein
MIRCRKSRLSRSERQQWWSMLRVMIRHAERDGYYETSFAERKATAGWAQRRIRRTRYE